MKKLALLLTLVLGLTLTVQAQKIAYFDIETVLNQMPEMEQAKAQMEKEQKELANQLEELQVEFNKKYKEYQDNMQLPDNDPNKWSKTILQYKEQELMDMQNKIQQFQQTASQTLQQRQVELLQPVYAKLDSAVGVVAKQKGYIMVLKKDDVFYINSSKVDDITAEVKKILGITKK